MPTSLRGIANKASSDKHHRFCNLFGLLTVAYLTPKGATLIFGALPHVPKSLSREEIAH
jgi:hypothetical protein